MQIIYSVSGSSGNCSVIQSSSGKLLCIDCGIRYDKVNRAIGYKLHNCHYALCSHRHGDHFAYRANFEARGIKVYYPLENGSKDEKGVVYEFDGFRVIAFPLVHHNNDGSECPCYGFLIQDIASGEKLLWCTDTQYIPYRFNALECYAIEANFWQCDDYSDELEAVEASVEKRRVNSHLSVESAVSFLKKQDLSKCKEIRLLHLSNSMTQAEKDRIIQFIKSEIEREDINIVF